MENFHFPPDAVTFDASGWKQTKHAVKWRRTAAISSVWEVFGLFLKWIHPKFVWCWQTGGFFWRVKVLIIGRRARTKWRTLPAPWLTCTSKVTWLLVRAAGCQGDGVMVPLHTPLMAASGPSAASALQPEGSGLTDELWLMINAQKQPPRSQSCMLGAGAAEAQRFLSAGTWKLIAPF